MNEMEVISGCTLLGFSGAGEKEAAAGKGILQFRCEIGCEEIWFCVS